MRELKKGTEVLVKAKIIRRASDNRLIEQCGYQVETSRSRNVYVEPDDIFCPLMAIQPSIEEANV